MASVATSSLRLTALTGGFRPFFLCAGLAAVFNMAVWLAIWLRFPLAALRQWAKA